jgi:RimJ/RimL family protein N-acetyltransferase
VHPTATAPQTDRVPLRDGREVVIRPILAADEHALARAFERLSMESRHRRFLSPVPSLSARQLHYLTDVDHHCHEALIAFDASTGDGVGTARYVRLPGNEATAEVAVTIIDDWQGIGLGRELLGRLAERAGQEGVSQLSGIVLAENRPMLRLLERVGDAERRPEGNGTVEVRVRLPRQPLRSAA